MHWDGATPGPWIAEFEGADTVIHLSGRSVNCRYTPANRRQIFDSRVIPTTLLGRAIAEANNPPRLWLNAPARMRLRPCSAIGETRGM